MWHVQAVRRENRPQPCSSSNSNALLARIASSDLLCRNEVTFMCKRAEMDTTVSRDQSRYNNEVYIFVVR